MKNDRHQRLLDLLRQRGEKSVEEFVKELDASEATIRRDLTMLETSGALIRTFGGARLKDPPSLTTRQLSEKRKAMGEEKGWIAKKAVQIVEPGMSVALDSGSTIWRIAEELKAKAPLDIVTNALPVIEELGAIEGIHIHCVGGRFNPHNMDLLGSEAVAAYSAIRVNIAFLGVDSVIPGRGVFANTREDADLLRAVALCADQCVVVADHTKLHARGLFLAVTPEQIHCLITDNGLPQESLKRLQAEPYRLIIADEETTQERR